MDDKVKYWQELSDYDLETAVAMLKSKRCLYVGFMWQAIAAMDKNEVINKVKQYKVLLKDYFNLETVYLFGSYARDTYDENSDIDVVIVVSDITGDFFSVNPLLWKLRRQIDDRIEPILIDRNNDRSGFLEEIKRSGIEIT
jgi:predicted nucleotidyltransferase